MIVATVARRWMARWWLSEFLNTDSYESKILFSVGAVLPESNTGGFGCESCRANRYRC